MTGKLSDLAGIFFFPFLLALVVAIPLSVQRHAQRLIGPIAFILTAAWFALAKATTVGNAATVEIVSAMLGKPVVVILDPTDLLALAALWPAWRLWRAMEQAADRPLSLRASIPVVIAAAIVVMATSPVRDRIGIMELRMIGDSLYAETINGYFFSIDGGKAWNGPQKDAPRFDIGDSIRRGLLRPDSLPKPLLDSLNRINEIDVREGPIAIDPLRPHILYGIGWDQSRLRRSDDSGKTWRIVWSLLADRETYMRRADRYIQSHSSRFEGSNKLTDLVVLPDGSGTVVASITDQGVVVIDSSGAWEQYPIGSFVPTPMYASSSGDSINTLVPEWIGMVGMAVVVGLLLSRYSWKRTRTTIERHDNGKQQRAPGCLPAILLTGAALLTLYLHAADLFFWLPALILLYFPAFIAALFTLVGIWHALDRIDEDSEAVRSRRACIVLTLLAFLLPALCFVLWTTGAITDYGTALILAALTTTAVGAEGMIHLRWLHELPSAI